MQRMEAREQRTLEETAALNYILLGDLRDLLEEPPDRETANWLLTVLDALLETLPYEFELKEEDGYLSAVLEEYPNWENLVERLLIEHVDLPAKLRELRARVAEDSSYAAAAAEVRVELRNWMMSLIAHQRHEARLLHTAMNLEVGGGD